MCLSIEINHPKSVLSKGEHAGYQFITVHNGYGFRCGYVRVPLGHPWHGKDYNDIEADVHGGLTFSEADTPCNERGDDDAYWVGFDCAHYGDAQDLTLLPDTKSHFGIPGGSVKTQAFVDNECRKLCEQAANATNSP